MTPRFSAYLYPWDLARFGVGAVLDELQDWHIDGVHLAANYHQITAASPRNDELRMMFIPRGAVFFPARHERYGRIQPSVWPNEDVIRIWHELSREIDARSMQLAVWTITMFQPWMAQDYPFAARETPFGDRTDAGVCPNSPDVQEYLAHLAVDMADQFDVSGFALEGNGLPLFDYGWMRRGSSPSSPTSANNCCGCASAQIANRWPANEDLIRRYSARRSAPSSERAASSTTARQPAPEQSTTRRSPRTTNSDRSAPRPSYGP